MSVFDFINRSVGFSSEKHGIEAYKDFFDSKTTLKGSEILKDPRTGDKCLVGHFDGIPLALMAMDDGKFIAELTTPPLSKRGNAGKTSVYECARAAVNSFKAALVLDESTESGFFTIVYAITGSDILRGLIVLDDVEKYIISSRIVGLPHDPDPATTLVLLQECLELLGEFARRAPLYRINLR